MPTLKQQITISVFEDGGCLINHKHEQFTKDGFIANSVEGALSAVDDLMHGLLPRMEDLSRRPRTEKPVYSMNKPRKQLD